MLVNVSIRDDLLICVHLLLGFLFSHTQLKLALHGHVHVTMELKFVLEPKYCCKK